MATLVVTIGKEALQICCHLPMIQEKRKNPKEIIEKLDAYFNPQINVIYERYVFFSLDQEANKTFDAYLLSLRKLTSSCEFAHLEEDLIRIILGKKDGGTRARMLRELSLILDQAGMMC